MYDATVNVTRAGTTVLTGVVVDIQAIDPYPLARDQVPVASEAIFDQYLILTLAYPMPDIRARDQLVDQSYIDPLTGTNAVYYVRRVSLFDGTIRADKLATRQTT